MTNKDISFIRGNTKEIVFTIVASDGTNYVLTSKDRLYFTIKTCCQTKNCTLQKTYGNGIIYDTNTNEYIIKLDSKDTCELESRSYVYDIEIIVDYDGSHIVSTLAKGNFTLEADVTHRSNEV